MLRVTHATLHTPRFHVGVRQRLGLGLCNSAQRYRLRERHYLGEKCSYRQRVGVSPENASTMRIRTRIPMGEKGAYGPFVRHVLRTEIGNRHIAMIGGEWKL